MTRQQRHTPTFLLQGFKRHLPLRVVIQVTIMQDLVVQCQAAVPEPLWNTGRQAGEAGSAGQRAALQSLPGKCPRQAPSALAAPLPCRRRFPIFLKLLPSHSRFRRCCLINSRISGWIFSRSSLWHTHPSQQKTMRWWYSGGRAGSR